MGDLQEAARLESAGAVHQAAEAAILNEAKCPSGEEEGHWAVSYEG